MLKQTAGRFSAPARTEAAEYYFRYIDLVPAGDMREALSRQLADTIELLDTIDSEKSMHRYGAGKWTIRQVVSHLSDTERSFAFRVFWFARGFDSELPSFDQEVAIATADADEQSWEDLVTEFRTVREATISLVSGLPAAAWDRRGTANGNEFTVRAVTYLIVGHVSHHLAILRERYL